MKTATHSLQLTAKPTKALTMLNRASTNLALNAQPDPVPLVIDFLSQGDFSPTDFDPSDFKTT